MAPPSTKAIEAALVQGTCEVWESDPDNTSVNKVRHHVEESLDLEEGFLSSEKWKQKSKSIIKEYVDKLLDGWKPDEPKIKKRASSEPQSPKAKRRKRSSTSTKPSAADEPDNGAEEKEEPEAEEDELVATKAKSRQSKSAKDTREEGESDQEEKSDEAENDSDGVIEPKGEPKPVAEEDEYSDVIDEPPAPKRKKGQKKEPTSKAPKQAKSVKASTSAAEDPLEAELKKLQSQLGKCGIRKLWHIELKQHGSDTKAKIRHLKKMLADIGMEGRFSEAKAREIRETRELLADAEAAQEMNRLWGTGTGTRASRSKSKNMKVDDSEGSGSGGENEDTDDEDNTFAARRKRAQADLAFLGDESDSD